MNPERIQSYASTSSSSRRFSDASDWGIEASTQTPTLSHQSFFSALGPPLTSRNSRGRDSLTSCSPRGGNLKIEPRCIDLHQLVKFTRKYLSLPSTSRKFMEDVKYQVILSCLLEDSMILSKNDQSLAALRKQMSSLVLPPKEYTSPIYPDGVVLQLSESKFNIPKPPEMSRPALVFPVLQFVYFLLKQSRLPQGHILLISKQSQWTVYRILLVVATKLIQYQRFHQFVRSLQATSLLLNFLASNYQFNRRLILGVIAIKEHEIYNFLPSPTTQDNGIKHDLATPLLGALQMAISSVAISISRLLKLIDGNLLEQYCSVNNLSILTLDLTMTAVSQESPLQAVTRHLQRFHQIRKLLLCIILSFCDDKVSCRTIFVESIATHLGIPESAGPYSDYCTSAQKMEVLHSVLSSANRTIMVCTQHLADIDSLSTMTRASVNDQNVLPLGPVKVEKVDGIATLISKLESLTLNMSQFAKVYSKDDRKLDSNRQSDKLRAFERFGHDLELIEHVHREMQREITENHSRSLLEHNLDVGLKSFRNTSIQNRISSPRSSWTQPLSRSSVSELEKASDRPRKYLSGILIEVVKVIDSSDSSEREASEIEPPIVSCDTIEKTGEIDALDASFLSKQDLAHKLEASFARIYALQTENQRLRAASPRTLAEIRSGVVCGEDTAKVCDEFGNTNGTNGVYGKTINDSTAERLCGQMDPDSKKQIALPAFLLDLESKLQL